MRLVEFDDSVNITDIENGIVKLVGCTKQGLKISAIAPMRNGLNMTWIQCPLEIAIKLANKYRRIPLGWSIARIELLEARPIQCFKCWAFGHAQGNCKSDISRLSHCFKCGKDNHKVLNCKNSFRCLFCQDIGKNMSHKMGSSLCEALKSKMTNRNENITS